jgi:hypothetical protein
LCLVYNKGERRDEREERGKQSYRCSPMKEVTAEISLLRTEAVAKVTLSGSWSNVKGLFSTPKKIVSVMKKLEEKEICKGGEKEGEGGRGRERERRREEN